MKLTERVIEKLECKPGQRDRMVFDDEQSGLAVRVSSGGTRVYLAQYSVGGTKHRVPLGACTAISLSAARAATAAIMGEVALNKNPAVDRKAAVQAAAKAAVAKAERSRFTLRVLVEDWERLHLATRRLRYATEAVRALKSAFTTHWENPAEDLDRSAVVRVLDGLMAADKPVKRRRGIAGNGTAIAGRTAAYGRACFGWACSRGTLASNPFANLPAIAKPPSRDRVLSDEEIIAVWHACDEATAPFGSLVRLLILTGQRREEVAGMAWQEVADNGKTWTIPGSRTKNGKPHIVPLSPPARALLPARRDSAASLVFTGRLKTAFAGWSKAKAELDEDSRVSGWRLHDLRRTCATGLQRLAVRLEVTESVLNHVSGSRAGIVGIYQRHDWATEKRTAMDLWAAHLTCPIHRPAALNVS